MTKKDFKDYCIMALKDSTTLFEVVENYFIEELVIAIMKKKIDSKRDITKDFALLQEWYGVPEMHILLLANVVFNLYDYYFPQKKD